jgi:hypothetical protein
VFQSKHSNNLGRREYNTRLHSSVNIQQFMGWCRILSTRLYIYLA